MRDIVFHYHIFKNAGSSFSSILDNNFGCGHLNIEASVPWEVLPQFEVVKFVHANPQMKAISSHTARLPPEETSGVRFHPMLFLRHPIDRIGSVYSFECRQPTDSPSIGAKIARESGIKEYVAWRLKRGNGAVIRNFQVVFISGRQQDMRCAEATKEDFKLALERIGQMKTFGLVECFYDSLVNFRNYFERQVGPFDIKITHKNESPDREDLLEVRIEVLKQALGAELYDELIEKNSFDIEFYNTASKLFLHMLN